MPFDPSAFDTPSHYDAVWSAPHRARLTVFPGQTAGWEDTVVGRVILAELGRRGLERADIQVTNAGDMIAVAGPEHVLSWDDTVSTIRKDAEATEVAVALRDVLEVTLANVARERMMVADGWRPGEPLPAWSLQTTPILQAAMALGGYAAEDLLRTYPLGWNDGATVAAGDVLHGDARDALPPEVKVAFNGASMLLTAETDAFMLTQHGETRLWLKDAGLGSEIGRHWIGRRVGEMLDLGPGALQDLIGRCTIRACATWTPDGPFVVALSAPMVTLTPIPAHALAAVAISDASPGAERFPLWTMARRLPPRLRTI